jgi:hypothetical protein
MAYINLYITTQSNVLCTIQKYLNAALPFPTAGKKQKSHQQSFHHPYLPLNNNQCKGNMG